MHWPDLNKLLIWLDKAVTWCADALAWLFAPQRIAVAALVIALVGVSIAYGPSLPGCGGPTQTPVPQPSPTPEPTPTMWSPVSPVAGQ